MAAIFLFVKDFDVSSVGGCTIVIVTGGGSLFFYNALKSIYCNVELMENAITSNVQGNYKIGEVKGWAI